MWELYLGLVIFSMVYGLLKLSNSLTESDTGMPDYDKLQNVSTSMLKLLFSLLALATVYMGLLITPSVIDASECQWNLNDTNNLVFQCVNETYSNLTSISSFNSVNEIVGIFEFAAFSSFLTYLAVGVVFFLAFFFVSYIGVFARIFFGKGRKGDDDE